MPNKDVTLKFRVQKQGNELTNLNKEVREAATNYANAVR